jgi:hypothetical protein
MLERPGNGELQDLVLTVHHCYMLTLSNTLALKLIENHLGRATVKQQAVASQQFIMQLPPQQLSPELQNELLTAGGPTN